MANFKTSMRIERAIRLEAKGCSDVVIADAIGLTAPGLAQLKMSPEYKQKRIQLTTGIIQELDEDLGEDIKGIRQRIRAAVPAALQAIVDTVSNTADPKLRLQAAEVILDRDGRFAKVSRTGLANEDQGGFTSHKDDEVAKNLVGLMGDNAPIKKETVQ